MADYFTHFSFMLPVNGKAEEADAIITAFVAARHDHPTHNPILGVEWEVQDGEIWLHDQYGCGNVESAIAVIQEVADKLKLKGELTFQWADTCSKPQLDAFGGGAVYLNLETAAACTMPTSEFRGVMRHPEFEDTMKAMAEENDMADENSPLTAAQLKKQYSDGEGWGEHPDHCNAYWQNDVFRGDTRLGYWEWVAARIEECALENALDIPSNSTSPEM